MYDKHIEELKKFPIPCEGWKPEVGREYVEWVHFVKQHQYYNGNAWCNCGLEFFLSFNLHKNPSFGRIVAVPLPDANDGGAVETNEKVTYCEICGDDRCAEFRDTNQCEFLITRNKMKYPAANDGGDAVSYYQPLFEHFSKEHGLTLLEGEMADIIQVVNKMQGQTYPAEFVEWAAINASYFPYVNFWHVRNQGADSDKYTTPELYEHWKENIKS